jgi:hypothetical protein
MRKQRMCRGCSEAESPCAVGRSAVFLGVFSRGLPWVPARGPRKRQVGWTLQGDVNTGAASLEGWGEEGYDDPYRHDVSSTRKRFFLEDMGCQMNRVDSELVAGRMQGAGYVRVDTRTRRTSSSTTRVPCVSTPKTRCSADSAG